MPNLVTLPHDPEVALGILLFPGTSPRHLACDVVDGADQAQVRSSTLEPVMAAVGIPPTAIAHLVARNCARRDYLSVLAEQLQSNGPEGAGGCPLHKAPALFSRSSRIQRIDPSFVSSVLEIQLESARSPSDAKHIGRGSACRSWA